MKFKIDTVNNDITIKSIIYLGKGIENWEVLNYVATTQDRRSGYDLFAQRLLPNSRSIFFHFLHFLSSPVQVPFPSLVYQANAV